MNNVLVIFQHISHEHSHHTNCNGIRFSDQTIVYRQNTFLPHLEEDDDVYYLVIDRFYNLDIVYMLYESMRYNTNI